ncbi:hypothetical protein TrRE_jg4864 [Triparma retinervis]|uniref:Uncharacterized protein n=1 Tax=Triparma retinervis TaxID=2557542 RepID=A0A9W7A8Q9_9STRA|nr:hypothetical protein TrRE_jg4864 [Triparma retinervis]
MSNIIYEDADEYDGFDGYDYPGDDGDNDVDEQYNHQPDSLDDCPDGEDVGELADALELNRKLKEIMSSGLDPTTMQNELSRLMSGMSVNQGMDDIPRGGGAMNPPPLSQVNSNTMETKMSSTGRGGQKKRVNVKTGPKIAKSRSAGKTFSDRESEVMAKNNALLLKKMIKIQTTKSQHVATK